MKVTLAESAGFCLGVGLALRKLDRVLAEKNPDAAIFTLGPIIHNPQVLADYRTKGVGRLDDPDLAEPGSLVVIRAHGVPRQVEQRLRSHGVKIVDATCPKVKKAQVLIARHTEEGKTLLLYGESDHPEVKGLLSHAGPDALVFGNLEELKNARLDPTGNYFLAAQTTQDRQVFESVINYLRDELELDIEILDTICNATLLRQKEAIEIARNVDFMVVAGGYQSGNTRRLCQVVKSVGTPCLHVETAAELPLQDLAGRKRIGLTAGASTPDYLIKEILEAIKTLPGQ